MKWDISRENNIFDFVDDDMKNISKDTIAQKNDIDEKEIQTMVFNRLGIKEKKKKKVTRRFITILAAAAVGTTILGTAAAAASGSFNAAFAERFAGEQSYGVFSGGNVQVSSNDNINAELLGISGDDHTVVGVLTLKNTDGSDFIPENDVENYFITESDCNDQIYLNNLTYSKNYLDVTKSLWSTITGDDSDQSNYIINYSLTDRKTIKCEIVFGDDSRNIKGERLSYGNSSIYLYHIDEILCQYDSSKERMDKLNQDIKNNSSETIDREFALMNEAKKTLKDNQVINFTSDWSTLVVATKTKIDINLDTAFTLNYRDTDRTLSVVEGAHSYNGASYTVQSVKASPFCTEITVSADISSSFYDTFGMKFFDDMEITLENGTVLYGCSYRDANTSDPNNYTFKTNYWKDKRYKNTDWVTVNPDEIVSISFNGETLAVK